MSLRYLLDTDVLSEGARPKPDPAVLRRLGEHSREIATASVVWHELLFGVERLAAGERRRFLEDFLSEVVLRTVPILPYDEAAAVWHARERARLTRDGKISPFADGLIAAVAPANGLTLVTGNVRHYSAFAGLRIESWRR